MRVERAVFTSDEHLDVRGYHLVARSAGIEDDLAQRLQVIAPTHDSLDGTDLHLSSLNYCSHEDWAIVSRTAFGGPEYSDRGSLRVVTTFLAVPLSSLHRFGNNPYLLTRIAHSLGLLRIPFPVARQIEAVEITGHSLLGQVPPATVGPVDSLLVRQLADSLGDTRPIAILGTPHPGHLIESLCAILAEEARPWVSFSTRLKPSINRPFRLQFCGSGDARRISMLEARGFRCVNAG